MLTPTPDGGLAHPDAPDVALTAAQLADHARSVVSAGEHLRLLVDDGARHTALLSQVADRLGCDILVAPVGAWVNLPGGADGAVVDAVPVDRDSGRVVDWALIQPPGPATPLPGWFDLVDGQVLTRTGLATLPLPEGVEYVASEDFVARRAAAARLGGGHPELVTVAVATDGTGFHLPTYRTDELTVPAGHDGQDLAAALAQIPLYGGDLRLWLRWPDDPTGHHRIATQLAVLAETTGATVWAPAPGGEAVLLPGCRDLGARDRAGNVTRWQEYRPPHAISAPMFTTDLDGRLVPAAGPQAGALGAVTVVSTRRATPATLGTRYAGLTAQPGSRLLDLSLLDDGRLALSYLDGSCLAVAGAVLRALLVNLGWTGEDLLLLTPVPPDAADGLCAHLTVLESALGVELWSLPPGASVEVRDGCARAVDGQRRPADWLRAGRAGPVPIGSRWYTDDGCLLPARREASWLSDRLDDRLSAPALAPPPAAPAAAPPPAAPAAAPPPAAPAAAPPPHRLLPAPSPHRVVVSRRADVGHGVPWVPDDPLVNATPIRLWLSSPCPPGRAAVEGIPAAGLFLVADLDGTRVAAANPGSYLLCLGVGAGGAIDLSQVDAAPVGVPAPQGDGFDAAGRFLLPAAWLDQVRLLAGYRVDDSGRPRRQVRLPAEPALLRCTGARHGIDGLPDEAVRWPGGARAWVILPAAPEAPAVGDALDAWLRRPAVRAGRRLARVRIPAGTAIDVRASAAVLAGLASVRNRLPELLMNEVDLVLPATSYDRVRADQLRYADGDRWRRLGRRVDLPLSALFESDPAAFAGQSTGYSPTSTAAASSTRDW
ncbi:hypothetical protein O7623_19050 [Solwaraspora sp. WMMD791]|uniref:hypothetical protein n=1 Tax=Solwaraspora sp. WMMD791 TaxID=3016086 RepID=UPI002499DD7F|nr:hypothetical protein [Solwaraspora sp. WMMD791]WFE25483.1 hypothetical protein O7623_19050 [Solwaraspora sp. WMMD791]